LNCGRKKYDVPSDFRRWCHLPGELDYISSHPDMYKTKQCRYLGKWWNYKTPKKKTKQNQFDF
jgi:hypothetical protein